VTLQNGQEAGPAGAGVVDRRWLVWIREYVDTVFKRILIVCMGNICRSPTAEYLFRQRMGSRDVEFRSAGLGALAGSSMDATALQLLSESGVDATLHRARQLTPFMLREADLVLGMEKDHVTAVIQLAPEACGKVYLLDKWLHGRDIPDPYRQQRAAFEHVHEIITQGVGSWEPYL
jgi:protein-tyrosine phosphatase